jgi:hypothetical protein
MGGKYPDNPNTSLLIINIQDGLKGTSHTSLYVPRLVSSDFCAILRNCGCHVRLFK